MLSLKKCWILTLFLTLSICGSLISATPEITSRDGTPSSVTDLENAEPDHFYVEFIRMLSLLGVILAFLLIVAWVFKRMMGKKIEQMNAASAIKVVERRTLSPKTGLFLIQVEDKRFLMAESHNGITLLGDIPEAPGFSSFQEILDEDPPKDKRWV